MERERRTIVTLDLPLPPSVNRAFAARRGSHLTMKTASYRFWMQEIKETYGRGDSLPTLGGAPYGLWIDLGPKVRGDIDNRVKLLSDVLKRPEPGKYGLGVVVDDREMWGLHVELVDGLARDRCRVTVVRMAEWPSYVVMRMDQ